MLPILLALALGNDGAPPLRLAMTEWRLLNLDPQAGAFYSEHLAQQMKLAGAEVITPREIGSLLGLERQKQLSGCGDESSSCIAELASALGTDALVLGDAAGAGDKVQLNVKVVRASDGKTIAVFSERVPTGEPTLDALTRAAAELSRQSATALSRSLSSTTASGSGGRAALRAWWLPAAAGALTTGVGAAFWAMSAGAAGRLRSATPADSLTDAQAVELKNTGATQQTAGVVLVAVGAALVVTGGAMFVAGRLGGPSVAIAPSPNGAVLVVGGRF